MVMTDTERLDAGPYASHGGTPFPRGHHPREARSPRGRHRRARDIRPGAVLALTAGATFLAFLDTTVVNIAFPALAESFPGASVSDLSWVISGYAVLLAALLTPGGRMADVIGRKRLFLGSLFLFTLMSAVAAISPSVVCLVTARAVQGAAAAGMIPAALGILLVEMPPHRRAASIGVWGASASMASAVGPALGGLLVEWDSWRAVFLINVPIGFLLIVGGMAGLPVDKPSTSRLPDLIGTVLVAIGIALPVAGLTEGSSWGWDSPRTVGAIAGGLLILLAALWRSRRHPAPAVEISLWRSPIFATANATSLLAGIGMFAWLLSAPLFCTVIWHFSVLEAGLAVTPGAFTSAVAAIIVGKRCSPRGQRIAVPVGLIGFAITGVWMYLSLGDTPAFLSVWLPAGLLGGASLGTTLTGLSAVAALSLPPDRFATGMGMNTTARQIGGALGVAATAVLLTRADVGPTQSFLQVFLMCGIAAMLSALVGMLLLRNPIGKPNHRPQRAASGAPRPSESDSRHAVHVAAGR